MAIRPSFIRATSDVPEHMHVYPQSTERMGPVRRVGKEAGLARIGINIQRLPPETRSSWPHAEEDEEEFVYVIDGQVDAWIDGNVHRMVAGDLAAFPAGTGICHCFINNTDREVLLLVGGEAPKPGSRIYYPLNPSRRADFDHSHWWHDVPYRELGPHNGLPSAARATVSHGSTSPTEQVLALRRAGKHEEACSVAVALAAQFPGDAELQYSAACVHDFLGREAQAVPFYLAAMAGTLSPEHLRSAYLGLGSTYRVLGQYAEAERTLHEGLARFPDAAEIKVFLAMALHNVGQSKRAVEMLLTVLAQSSADAHVQSYREAILYYADDIERSWTDAG